MTNSSHNSPVSTEMWEQSVRFTLAVMLTVLASLGPIVAFFSASTTIYPFMLLLDRARHGSICYN